MCGSTRSTTSPSSSSTRRRTPCAAGCWGPKLMVKLRSSVSAMSHPAPTARSELLLFATCHSLFAGPFISRPLPARGLLVPRQAVARTFPRREEIEIAEFLGEAHLLVHDALLLVVVADLDEPGERKILAQRMALEAVVGEQPAHVRMAGEDYTVEIVGLALEPVGAGKDADDGSDRRLLVDLELHPDAQVQLGREQMVDDVEPPLAPGPVDRRDVEQA